MHLRHWACPPQNYDSKYFRRFWENCQQSSVSALLSEGRHCHCCCHSSCQDTQASVRDKRLLLTDGGTLRLKCDGTRAETRFRLSAKRTIPFKSVGASAQSTTGSRGVRISDSNAGYTTSRGSVKSTGYPLHSPISSSLPLPCVTVCHHISNGLYFRKA